MKLQENNQNNPINDLDELFGLNAGYVVELYERYLQDPASVSPQMRAWLGRLPPGEVLAEAEAPPTAPTPFTIDTIVGASNLSRAIRSFGHLAADLSPLGAMPPGDPALDLGTYGLTEHDLRQLPAHIVGGPLASRGSERRGRDRPPPLDLLWHHRLRVSPRPEQRRAPLAHERGRDLPLRRAERANRPPGGPGAADQSRSIRAIPAPNLPRPEALFD